MRGGGKLGGEGLGGNFLSKFFDNRRRDSFSVRPGSWVAGDVLADPGKDARESYGRQVAGPVNASK